MTKAKKRKQKRLKRNRQKARKPLSDLLGHWPPEKADLVSNSEAIRMVAKRYFECQGNNIDWIEDTVELANLIRIKELSHLLI